MTKGVRSERVLNPETLDRKYAELQDQNRREPVPNTDFGRLDREYSDAPERKSEIVFDDPTKVHGPGSE